LHFSPSSFVAAHASGDPRQVPFTQARAVHEGPPPGHWQQTAGQFTGSVQDWPPSTGAKVHGPSEETDSLDCDVEVVTLLAVSVPSTRVSDTLSDATDFSTVHDRPQPAARASKKVRLTTRTFRMFPPRGLPYAA
jgi:hypothetical protein